MIEQTSMRTIGTMDGQEIAVGTFKGSPAASIGFTCFFVTGWVALYPEQAAAWGIGTWWHKNRAAFLDLLQTEGALSQKVRTDIERGSRAKEELEKVGFSFMLDRMPLLPLIVTDR